MNEKEILQVVADEAADDLKLMSAYSPGVLAYPTPLKDGFRTNTKGYYFNCGTLKTGHRAYYFQVWLDQFVKFTTEDKPFSHFWYGISARSAESLSLIIEHLPKHLQPVHELRRADVHSDGTIRRVTQDFPPGFSGKVIRESVDSGAHYLGVYEASVDRTKAELRAFGTKAAEFWRQVLGAAHDLEQVDEIILDGQEITRTAKARSRSAKLRKYAVKHFQPLKCYACGFSTPKLPQLKNREIVEFHHKKPVSWHDVAGIKQSSSQARKLLIPLCPTCHRIAHSTPAGSGKIFAIADIRRIKNAATQKVPPARRPSPL